MADPNEPEIGTLRWQVRIFQRPQAPQPGGTGITETLVPIAIVHADVQPIGALTFYAAQQTDGPVTHRITMRWQDYTIDNTYMIQRQTQRQDGTIRTETFRIRRIAELGGRKRFVAFDCELEQAS